MREKAKKWFTIAVGSIGSIVGAIGAITTLGLIEAGIKASKKNPTTEEEKSD